MSDQLVNQTVDCYNHLHVGDTVHIIRNESCAYRCPICKGKGKFKAVGEAQSGLIIHGKMKCKHCIGIGAIAVDRYRPITVTINAIDIWNDGDVIIRTDNLYHVGVDETLYQSHEYAQSACDALNTNIYVKCGNYHVSKDTQPVPNNSYVDFGKRGKFYIDANGDVARV